MNERQDIVDHYLTRRTRTNRDAVIATYFYLCKRGARKFRRGTSDPADLEQVAAVGLVKATDSYRAERTTPFEAYAWLIIVGELMHYVRDCEQTVRLPRALRSLDRRYLVAWESLASEHHSEPTPRQLAEALDVPISMVEALQAFRRGYAESEINGTDRFERTSHAPLGITLEEKLTLDAAVGELNERERIIVLGTFGAGLSQLEVAQRLGLSQSQVSKLLTRALGKLSPRVA